VDLHADTTTDSDSVEFDTTPGAEVEFELVLDGVTDPRYVYWFGSGYLHEGSSSTPVWLVPDSL
jgi:hypothetical protein